MARKGMRGQLNMFDFFSSMEAGTPGEVEMVSLVPNFEEEALVVETVPEVEEEIQEVEESVQEMIIEKKQENIAMSRSYTRDGVVIEIAYINYNKVRIIKGDARPIIKEFASTKEAVDYYVEQMQELEADE